MLAELSELATLIGLETYPASFAETALIDRLAVGVIGDSVAVRLLRRSDRTEATLSDVTSVGDGVSSQSSKDA